MRRIGIVTSVLETDADAQARYAVLRQALQQLGWTEGRNIQSKRGTRPSAPRDQRTASTYIFGAVCPKRAALILPACNTEAMNLHLAEIAAAVEPAAHAVVLVPGFVFGRDGKRCNSRPREQR